MLFPIVFVIAIVTVCSSLSVHFRLRRSGFKFKAWHTPAESWRHNKRLWHLAKTHQLPWLPVIFTIAGIPFVIAVVFLGLVFSR